MKGTMNTCVSVNLRRKPMKNGKASLYLDYYPAVRNPQTMKMTRREFLGFYIYDKPKNAIEREYNDEMMMKAELIRCKRQTAVINEEFGFTDKYKQMMNALDYFHKIAIKKGDKYLFAYAHFEKFVHGKCTFGDITVDLCKKFAEYLTTAHSLRHNEQKICQNCAAAYWSTFRAMLKQAYLDKYFKENLNDYLESMEDEEVHKEFLTLEEVQRLANTPCKFDVLKRASLFSCLTGLRISDIENLTWDKIELGSDGGYWIRIKTIKTGTEATLPISNEALELCGPLGEGKVFKGLKRSMIQVPLRRWIIDAQIEKHITFHCFRHTYATLQVAAGTDIYTVSKMLTHRNVSTTQIYADLVSAKKRETTGKISLK